MKWLFGGSMIVGAWICTSAFAGSETDYKQVATTPATASWGTGWYFAVDGGANVYQNFGGNKDVLIGGTPFRAGLDSHVGGFGGIKFGYIFGNGPWRFGLEEDWFYNGFESDAIIKTPAGNDVASADARFNTGAFMTNAILKYAARGGCPWQPYIFGGVGGWWGASEDIDLVVAGTPVTVGGRNDGGFAFQVGGGLDYYFTPKMSVFTEYKFLDYTNAGSEFNHNNVRQHLVGAGVKIHF